MAILINRFKLATWNQIGEEIATREKLKLVPSYESAHADYRIRVDQASPGRGDIEGSNLRALVGLGNGIAKWIESANLERIVGIRLLEPGTSEIEIQL